MKVTRLFGTGLFVAAVSLGLVPAEGRAQGAATEAIGLVQARVAAVAPLTANLALEVGMAQSAADISGAVARGESASFTFGIIGLLAGSLPVPLPQPAKADTRNTESVDRTAVLPPVGVSPVVVQTTHEQASVTKAPPSGAARTTLGDVEIPNLLRVGGGVSEAKIDANLGEAFSSVGELRIAPLGTPLIILEGLEWRAAQAAGAEPTASFSIGSAWVMGTRYPADGPAEMQALFEAMNVALTPTGFTIVAPELVRQTDGSLRVTPLRIQLRDSQVAKESVGRVYPNIADQVNAVFNGVGDVAPPEAGLALLVANVGIAALTGNGGVRAEIGGASARLSTREIPNLDQFRKRTGTAAPAAGAGSGGSGTSTAVAPVDLPRPVAAGPVGAGPVTAAASGGRPGPAPVAQALPAATGASTSGAGGGLLAVPASSTAAAGVPAWLVVLLALAGLATLWFGDHARSRSLALSQRGWTDNTGR